MLEECGVAGKNRGAIAPGLPIAIARGPTGKGFPKPDSREGNPRGSIGQNGYSPRAPLGLQFENSTEAIRVCQSRHSESGHDLQGGNLKKQGARSLKRREKSGNPYPERT